MRIASLVIELLVTMAALAGDHEAIYPADRVFTPEEVRAALARPRANSLAPWIQQLAKDPAQVAKLLELSRKLRSGGNRQQVLDELERDPRMRELIESLQKNPSFRPENLLDPRLKGAMEQLDKMEKLSQEPATTDAPSGTDANPPSEKGDARMVPQAQAAAEPVEKPAKERFTVPSSTSLPEIIEPKAASKALLDMANGLRRFAWPLRNSPALTRAVARLQNRIPWETGSLGLRDTTVPELLRQLGVGEQNPEQLVGSDQVRRLGKTLRERLFADLPSLPKLAPSSLPSVPRLEAVKPPLPDFSTPPMPASSWSSPGVLPSIRLLAIVAAAVALLLWFWRRWPGRRLRAATSARNWRWENSPRGRIRRAFEELALATLGTSAERRHHRAIEAYWREHAAGAGGAAAKLADEYEVARYAPASDPVDAAQAEQAVAFRRLIESKMRKSS